MHLRNPWFLRFSATAAAGLWLANCAGVTPFLSWGTSGGSAAQRSLINARLPVAQAFQDLLYVFVLSGSQKDEVPFFTYPGGQLEGTLATVKDVGGICSDRSGHVYILDRRHGKVDVYKHGSTSLLRILSDKNSSPRGCAGDPSTGDLAVVNDFVASGPGNVAVYLPGKRNPTLYSDPAMPHPTGCTYGPLGMLYVWGIGAASNTVYAEITPSKSSTFTPVVLNGPVSLLSPAPIFQFDRFGDLAIHALLSQGDGVVRYSLQEVSGTIYGTEAGSTIFRRLHGLADAGFLDGELVLLAVQLNKGATEIEYRNYPKGTLHAVGPNLNMALPLGISLSR